MTLKKILMPLDFSGRSAAAAVHARLIADRYKSEVTVLHVVPPLYPPVGSMEAGTIPLVELYEARKLDAERLADEFIAEHLAGVKAQKLILSGDPAHHIISYAHSDHTDLIVMPTHGYGPFRRFLLGSVAAKVLHDADCPVLTGAHLEEAAAPLSSFQSIVAAVDLGSCSERVLTWAAGFASDNNARLTTVHAAPSLEGRTGEYFDPEWRQQLIHQAEERVRELLNKTGVTGDIHVEAGDAASVVHHAADKVSADIAVIGRHANEGILGRLKAHGYAIIRHAPCAVVSV